MKKILFIAAIGSLSLASCKKDYTCECTASFFGTTFIAKSAANSTKKGAEEWCKSQQNSTTTVDGQVQTNVIPLTCAIK
jgi:hypothetical protein